MNPQTRPHTVLSLFAAALFSLVACEGAPTAATADAGRAPPALNVSHPCSPLVSGPSTLAVNEQGTYTLTYSSCTNPSVSWSVNNGAQILWTSSVTTQLNGSLVAGSAGVKAGQCDFTVTANSSYNGGNPAVTTKQVLVRDCTPLHVTLSPGSTPVGSIKLTWNAVRADSFRVYRKVIPRAGGPDPGFTYRGTSTGTTYTDVGYRISDRNVYEFNVWYRVEAYDSYGFLTDHTVYTWAVDNIDDI
jgi:hypothetical protein